MSRSNRLRRKLITLVFALILTLAGLGLLASQTSAGNSMMSIFLPLVVNQPSQGSIPGR